MESTFEEADKQVEAPEGVDAQDVAKEPVARRPLGVLRYVQFAFVAFTLFLVWLLDKLVAWVWAYFAEPPALGVTAIAVLGALAISFFVLRQESVKKVSMDVATEIARVSWPSQAEVWNAAVVVVVTSIFAALYFGLFDGIWSALTDLVYGG